MRWSAVGFAVGSVPRPDRYRRRAALLGGILVALLAREARAQLGTETSPPLRGPSAGDISAPPTGSPGAPPAPGTPLWRDGELGRPGAGPSATGRLLEGIAGATGADPIGSVPPGDWISLDPFLDPILGAAAGRNGSEGTSVYPLPVVANSRNEGLTVGAITPIVFTNARGEVTRVLAPTFTYNEIFGFQGGAHALLYEGTFIVAGGGYVSNRIARDLYIDVYDAAFLGGRAAIEGFARHVIDPSERWWGFGADTPASNETNYTQHLTAVRLNLGWNVTPRIQLFGRERLSQYEVAAGRVQGVPSTAAVFGPVPGIPRSTIVGHGLELRVDYRDQAFRPRRGFWLGLVAEANVAVAGNSAPLFPRFIADLRGFWTPGNLALDWITLAARVRVEAVPGSRVPFYERALLGGPLTLRAFGTSRFTGSGSFLLQLEARGTVFSRRVLGTWIEIAVVPFLDVGRVFEDLEDVSMRYWQVNPGVGIRLGVPPSIVARIDGAWGADGGNVYVGLGLPF